MHFMMHWKVYSYYKELQCTALENGSPVITAFWSYMFCPLVSSFFRFLQKFFLMIFTKNEWLYNVPVLILYIKIWHQGLIKDIMPVFLFA